jgi:ABC-type cobalamin/Fe3+-siderophores transport system ATPase subunit
MAAESRLDGLCTFGPYALAGWRVVSDLELPELLPWADVEAAGHPLRVEVSDVAAIPGPRGFEAAADGGVRLRVAEVALFEVAPSGDHVAVHRVRDADPMVVRAHLYGSVLAILCYRRGLLPLHGASVRIGGRAAVLSGPSGVGKSTLATALARRGHVLLSDDVSPADLSDPERPMLWPAFPRVKLLDDAIATFQLDGATAYTQAPRGTKGHFGMAAPTPDEGVTKAIPLGGVFALDAHGEDAVSCERLASLPAFAFLNSQTHRARMGRLMGAQERMFHQVYRVVSAVPVWRLKRPKDLGRLNESAEVVEAAMAGDAVG